MRQQVGAAGWDGPLDLRHERREAIPIEEPDRSLEDTRLIGPVDLIGPDHAVRVSRAVPWEWGALGHLPSLRVVRRPRSVPPSRRGRSP